MGVLLRQGAEGKEKEGKRGKSGREKEKEGTEGREKREGSEREFGPPTFQMLPSPVSKEDCQPP